jgi:hypothetical protein
MSVRERQDQTLRGLLTQVDAVLSGTGLKRSPSLFSANDLPKTLVDNSYCMAIQSADTQLYREGGEESARVIHQLTLSVLKQIKPMAQFQSLLDAGDVEERMMASMLRRSNLPYAVVKWVSTQRTPTPSREYLLLESIYSLECDWSWSGLNA